MLTCERLLLTVDLWTVDADCGQWMLTVDLWTVDADC